jgi:hypothetical protein
MGYFQCISCNRIKPLDQMNAGHYYPVGTHSALRYHEINVNGQCIQCNKWQYGNQAGYRAGLVRKYGETNVVKFETRAALNRVYKWSRFELELICKTYSEKMKEII